VQAELVWVLEDAFGANKPEIVSLLRHLLANQAFVLQNEASFEGALAEYETGSADFADCLILAEARAASYPLVTFDKRLQRTKGVQKLAD
jgi:predicted nucleic-acid-binding protein